MCRDIARNIESERLPDIARLAMLPPALVGGRGGGADAVYPRAPRHSGPSLAANVRRILMLPAVLAQWWQTYIESRPPFSVRRSLHSTNC